MGSEVQSAGRYLNKITFLGTPSIKN